VNQANDGERSLLLAVDSEQQSKGSIEDPKLTLLEEELTVGKEAVETGRLRVSKQTHTREASIDENLLSEHADIERVPVGRQVFEMPLIRQEGDTTIVPIVEEVIHTERRLFLKEEIKITRRRTTEQFHDRVTLRIKKRSLRAFRVRLSRSTLRRPRKSKRQILGSSKYGLRDFGCCLRHTHPC
jgi:uncharacterized protein (TIGR02271 family)